MSELASVQSRKWQITINNPTEHCFTHDDIISIMSTVHGKSLYWCMCDEIGDECETLHTHIFLYRKSPFTAATIQNLFPNMHRERVRGTPAENRAYVLKDGEKFNKDASGHYHYIDSGGKAHDGTNFSDTFYEFGDCPEEHQGVSSTDEIVVDLIREGASNETIIDSVPSVYKNLEKVERVRSLFRDAKFRDSWRDLQVTYMFGRTGAGKTRSVMEQYHYQCYRVTDYKHPFDSYDGQDVIIFEEFRSGLKHGDMLSYLDGYPIQLPCRYFNRWACYTKVYILSNLPPTEQYTGVDAESRNAFFRRIHKVIEFHDAGFTQEYNGVQDYIRRDKWVQDAIKSPPM